MRLSRLLILNVILVFVCGCSSTNVINLEGSDTTRFSDLRLSFPVTKEDEGKRIKLRLTDASGEFSQDIPEGKIVDFEDFRLADCPKCEGILKPDVVFFGDYVPKDRVYSALDMLKASDGLLVIGSSLMVYSGFRFARQAAAAGYAVASVGSAAVGAIAEKPELLGRVVILVGLAEGIAIYGLIIAILILNRLG